MSSSCARHLRQPLPAGADTGRVVAEFVGAVNMEAEELERFLESEGSREASRHGEEHSKEHEARRWTRRVIELLQKLGETREDPQEYPHSLLYEGDLEQMHQVCEYIKCARQQRPTGDVEHSVWRWNLMSFGFDPLKPAAPIAGGVF